MSKSLIIILILILLLLLGAMVWWLWDFGPPFSFYHKQENALIMKLTSPNFENGQMIPQKYTCDADNVSPALIINEVPEGAKSLAIVMLDPDVAVGTWIHWTVWNIDPKTNEVAENSVPSGAVEGKTSFGKPGYGGPCPPTGTHHYIFRIYALDTMLDLGPDADNQALEEAMSGHVIGKAEFGGKYSRD